MDKIDQERERIADNTFRTIAATALLATLLPIGYMEVRERSRQNEGIKNTHELVSQDMKGASYICFGTYVIGITGAFLYKAKRNRDLLNNILNDEESED